MTIILIFLGVLVATGFLIFAYNFRPEIQNEALTRLYQDEQLADTLHTSSIYDKQNTYLTNRRLYQIQKKWFLSRTLFTYLDLKEISSIHYVEMLNIYALIFGALLTFIFMPAGYVLILFGFLNYIVRLTFYTNNRKMRIHSSMADKPSFRAFLHRVQAHSFREKTGIVSDAPLMPAVNKSVSNDFRLGMPAISVIAIYYFLGGLQKILQGSIKFDDFHFFPLYLALPLIAGYWFGKHTGLKAGFFGTLALITLIFPVPFYSVGKTLFLTEYLALLIYLSAGGWLAGLIRRRETGIVVIAGWLILVAFFCREEFNNLYLYMKLLLALIYYQIATLLYKKDKTENINSSNKSV